MKIEPYSSYLPLVKQNLHNFRNGKIVKDFIKNIRSFLEWGGFFKTIQLLARRNNDGFSAGQARILFRTWRS